MSTAEAVGPSAATPQKSGNETPYLTNLGRVLGAVGLVLLLTTPVTYLLTADFGPMIWAKLTIALVLIGFYLATNAGFFARTVGARATGLTAMSAAGVGLVLLLVAVGNYVAYKNSQEFDFTRESIHTLSPQTRGALDRLKAKVDVLAFFTNYDPAYQAVHETLQRYRAQSDLFTYTFVDPLRDPALATKYNITESGPRIVVTSGAQEARAKDASEEAITNAIIRVNEQTAKGIYFLTGHGEGDTTDDTSENGFKAFADAVAAEGYAVHSFSLLNTPPPTDAPGDVNVNPSTPSPAPDEGLVIPDDADVLIIAGPHASLMQPEVDAVEGFLNRGGRVMAFLEPETKSGLDGLLRQWKIDIKNDMVVDISPLNRLLQLGPAAPMVRPADTAHPISKDLLSAGVMMTARSMGTIVGEAANGGEVGVTVTPFLMVAQPAWGETNLGDDGSAERDDDDNLGPLYVGVAATRPIEEDARRLTEEGRLVVFGDADFVNNRFLPVQGNTDIALNAVNWTAAEESKITIRPKQRKSSQLFLTGGQLNEIKFFSVDIVPALLVAMGLGIVLIRRQK